MDCSEMGNEMVLDAISKATVQNTQQSVDELCTIAGRFCHYYYDMLEKKPHLVGQLYLENSVFLWDGNPAVTREGIQKFIEKLPSLTFKLTAMDCQAINPIAVGSKSSFLIKTSGQLRVSGGGTVRGFSQQILVTADNDKWRIATDCFRSQV